MPLTLTDLPLEILRGIFVRIDHRRSYRFNFVIASRTLYTSLITELYRDARIYRAPINRFDDQGNFNIDKPPVQDLGGLSFVRTVAVAKPHLASAVRRLEFAKRTRRGPAPGSWPEQRTLSDTESRAVDEALKPRVNDRHRRYMLAECRRAAYEDPSSLECLILMLLPNLERASIHVSSRKQDFPCSAEFHLVRAATAATAAAARGVPLPPLTNFHRLTHLDLRRELEANYLPSRRSFLRILPVLALPSLKRLAAEGITEDSRTVEQDAVYAADGSRYGATEAELAATKGTSSVAHLHLYGAYSDPSSSPSPSSSAGGGGGGGGRSRGGIRHLIEACARLESFVFEQEGGGGVVDDDDDDDALESPWDPGVFGPVLVGCAAHSLRNLWLDVFVGQLWVRTHANVLDEKLGFLKELVVLERLHVRMMNLLGEDFDGGLPRYDLEGFEEVDEDYVKPSLLDVLPASLRVLHVTGVGLGMYGFYTRQWLGPLERLVDGNDSRRSEGGLVLEKLCLGASPSGTVFTLKGIECLNQLRTACENAGVEFCVGLQSFKQSWADTFDTDEFLS